MDGIFDKIWVEIKIKDFFIFYFCLISIILRRFRKFNSETTILIPIYPATVV